jgi:predicted nucleic acid-binding protein
MRIFVDTGIILAFLAGQDPRAQEIIAAMENRKVTGYINPLAVDEAVHGYIRLATGYGSQRIRMLAHILREDILPVHPSSLLAAEPGEVIEIMEEYGLMPADALTALTCRRRE